MRKFWEAAPFVLLFLIMTSVLVGAMVQSGVTFGNPFHQLFFFNY